jgi:hypothetical protein
LKSDEGLATVPTVAGFLHRFYEAVDSADATARCAAMLSEDLRFSVLFSTPEGDAQDFAGGRDEWDEYMRGRGTPAWTHHVLAESEDNGVEMAFGETRQDGAVVATWVAAVRLDEQGRLSRYIVGRSPAVAFELG